MVASLSLVLVEVGDGLFDAVDDELPHLFLRDDAGLADPVASDELFLVDVVIDAINAVEDEEGLAVGDLLALPGGPGDAAGLVALDFEGQEVDQVVEVHAVFVTSLPFPAADGDEVFDGEFHLALLSGAGVEFDAAEEGGPLDVPAAGLFGGADGAVAGPVADGVDGDAREGGGFAGGEGLGHGGLLSALPIVYTTLHKFCRVACDIF